MQHIPQWKKFLSFLAEINLEESSSVHNPEIIISLHKGRYKLSTSNAVYSFDDLYYCFSQAFDYVDIQNRNIQSVLVLGYGLGSITAILSKTFSLHPKITGVEIDPEIVRLHAKYGSFHNQVHLIEADAVSFIKTQKETFDLICVDVFSDHRIPDTLDTPEFLNDIAGSLNDKGIVIFNRMDDDQKNIMQNKAFLSQFSTVFPAFQLFRVRQNLMHIGYKR